MQLRIAVGLLLSFFSFTTKAQIIPALAKASDKEFFVRIAAHVLDASSKKPIVFATVTHLRTKKAVATDTAGYFTTVMSQKDTLRITSVGYQDLLYVKDGKQQGNYFTNILMYSKSYELDAVTIVGQKLRSRYRPMTVRPEYESEQEWRRSLIEKGEPRNKVSLGSPISALYEMFGKRPRQQRKLDDLVMRRAIEERITTRYNRNVVAQQTGLSGDDLTEFMRYCPISQEFILEASDYELAERISRCFEALRNGE